MLLWSEVIGRSAGAVLAGRVATSSDVAVKVSANGGNRQSERENEGTSSFFDIVHMLSQSCDSEHLSLKGGVDVISILRCRSKKVGHGAYGLNLRAMPSLSTGSRSFYMKL
jgi:hypothetical protein